jgi:hypothetical protein
LRFLQRFFLPASPARDALVAKPEPTFHRRFLHFFLIGIATARGQDGAAPAAEPTIRATVPEPAAM